MGNAPNRVLRGGSFNNNASNLLSAFRNNNDPTNRNNNVGARCAKTVILRARASRIGAIKAAPSVIPTVHPTGAVPPFKKEAR